MTRQTVNFDLQVAFAADVKRRTITGVAVPWGKIGKHEGGRRWRFERGSLVFGHHKYVWLNDEHVRAARIGRAIDAQDTDEGLVVTFKIDPGPAGDRALAAYAMGTRTGLSVEVDIDTADIVDDPDNPGVQLVMMANWTGVGYVRRPAFPDSRIIAVTASSNQRGTGMPPDDPTTEPAGTAGDPTTTPPAPEPAGTATAVLDRHPQAPVTFTSEQFAEFLETVRGGAQAPAGPGRPVVDPTRGGNTTPPAQVTEPLPYTFSAVGGKTVFAADAEFDFSTDLLGIAQSAEQRRPPDAAAITRVNAMISAYFADVERADVAAVNPNRHRPDMWVRQRDYRRVLWDMIAAGTTDGTKFDVPKFTSSGGLVGPTTEKTEPEGGSFVAELQTITPTQVWGKVEITRQAWRAGGNPALSGILWDQMLREYYEDREAAVATFLNTLTAAADIALPNRPATSPDNDDDQAIANALEIAIAMLQFDRGGDGISAFAVHRDLFKVLAQVTDDAGRKLYPLLNPENASGTAQPRWRTMNIGGVTAAGAYALGASGTASTNSWLFDPATVYGWASAPERLFWDFGATVQTANIPQLSFVTLGIYGDVAFANTDITGVRQVTFDPSQD